MFDISTGRETASFPSSSTKPDTRPSSSSSSLSSVRPSDVGDEPLLEPHGVCADQHGLVFVADRRARAVRIFDDRCGVQTTAGSSKSTAGRSIASYDDERHRVGLPFAVACNQRGQLAVAEYVGTVRVFSYFVDTHSDRWNAAVPSLVIYGVLKKWIPTVSQETVLKCVPVKPVLSDLGDTPSSTTQVY